MVGCVGVFGKPNFSWSRIEIVKKGEVFKVIYQGPAKATVNVSKLNADNLSVFSEKIVSPGSFIRPYNFSKLPKGDYKICVDDQNGVHVEKLCNTESKDVEAHLEVNRNELLAHVSKLQNENNKYLVCVPHQRETELEIRIYDQDQQLVFTEKKAVDNFAKVYTLKNLAGASIGVAKRSTGEEKLFKLE